MGHCPYLNVIVYQDSALTKMFFENRRDEDHALCCIFPAFREDMLRPVVVEQSQ